MIFKAGDRVVIPITIGEPELRRGVIAEVYESIPDGLGRTMVMYAVLWNDALDVVDRGYIVGGGLRPEPLSVGGLGI